MIEKLKLVSLSKDNKVVALKQLTSIYHSTGEMLNQIKNNQLTEEMKDILFNLIEHYTSEASKALKYDSKASKRIAERYADIKKANQRIDELEKLLIENSKVTGLKELLDAMHHAVYKWWRNQGFNLVTDNNFGVFGYKGRFCLDTSSISYIATRPVTGKEEKKSRLEQMIGEGYEFHQEHTEYILLDTPKNRELITKLVRDKFPSIDISKWENWCVSKTDKFELRSFEAYIRNLEELKILIGEVSQPNYKEI